MIGGQNDWRRLHKLNKPTKETKAFHFYFDYGLWSFNWTVTGRGVKKLPSVALRSFPITSGNLPRIALRGIRVGTKRQNDWWTKRLRKKTKAFHFFILITDCGALMTKMTLPTSG